MVVGWTRDRKEKDGSARRRYGQASMEGVAVESETVRVCGNGLEGLDQ
jgi:hypothetical protein